MFDVGFSELAVIGVVALIVIGPEELPRVARTAGHLMGRLRRYVADVKSDISREMEMADLKRMHEEVEASAREIKDSLSEQARELESELQRTIAIPAVAEQVSQSLAAEPAPLPHVAAATANEAIATSVPASDSPAEAADMPVEKDENQLDLFAAGAPQAPNSAGSERS